jgi:hypothetical protein
MLFVPVSLLICACIPAYMCLYPCLYKRITQDRSQGIHSLTCLNTHVTDTFVMSQYPSRRRTLNSPLRGNLGIFLGTIPRRGYHLVSPRQKGEVKVPRQKGQVKVPRQKGQVKVPRQKGQVKVLGRYVTCLNAHLCPMYSSCLNAHLCHMSQCPSMSLSMHTRDD